eukprot:SAG31_NODE_9_length_42330_cov_441.979162_8_plen_514_part_00
MDPYCVIRYGDQERKTSVKKWAGGDPIWEEKFSFNGTPEVSTLELTCMDRDSLSRDDVVGIGKLGLSDLFSTGFLDKLVPLTKHGVPQGQIRLVCKFGHGLGAPAKLNYQTHPVSVVGTDAYNNEHAGISREEALAFFKAVDTSHDGVLSVSEIAHGLHDYGCSHAEAEQLFLQLDENSDNEVTFGEFLRGWSKWKALAAAHTSKKAEASVAAPLPPPHNSAQSVEGFQHVKVLVYTGTLHGAGTDAKIWLKLTGTKGTSKKLDLPNTFGPPCFERGAVDCFIIDLNIDIGNLLSCEIGHDNSNPGAGWYLHQVVVHNATNISNNACTSAVFTADCWIPEVSGGVGSGAQLSVTLENSTPPEDEPSVTERNRHRLWKAFRKLDVDHDGHLSRNEIMAGLQRFFPNSANRRTVDDLQRKADQNRDGGVSFEEFVRAVLDSGWTGEASSGLSGGGNMNSQIDRTSTNSAPHFVARENQRSRTADSNAGHHAVQTANTKRQYHTGGRLDDEMLLRF